MGQSLSRNSFGAHELEEKIQHLRGNAMKAIENFAKKYHQNITVINDEEVDLFLHQIKNKMLLVAIVGEGSAGKSTLINALLRDRLLPSGIGRVTGVRMFIAHDPDVHDSPCKSPTGACDNCPFLVRGFMGKNKSCQGIKNIESRIKDENTTHGNKGQPLVLYTYIPVFASLDFLGSSSHCTPYLVDSPGVEVINADVHSYYSIQSAMIYVENYQRLLQNEENIKKELALRAKNASLLFVVTHFDNYFTSFNEANPDKEGTKKFVSDAITEVECDDVFPVCGKWALNAHLALKYHEKDKNASQAVELACTEYRSITKQNVPTDINGKAKFLLNITAFKELEESLKNSIATADFRQWNINMYNQCQELLKGPIQVGTTVLQEIESKETSKTTDIDKLRGKVKILRSSEEELEQYCSEGLKQSFERMSFDFERRLYPKIETPLHIFREICKDNVKRKYNFGQFVKDADTFKEHTLSEAIKKEINEEVNRCVEALKCQLEERYKTLISHISEEDPNSVVLNAAADAQNFDNYSVKESFDNIKDFVKAFNTKLWTFAKGILSGVGGFGVPGGLVAGGLCASALPLIVWSAPVFGLLGGAYYMHKTWKIKDDEMELSEKEIEELCDKILLDIKGNSGDIKHVLNETVLGTLREYNKSLKDNYDRKWKWKLDKELKEAQDSLVLLRDEMKQVTQALAEIQECNSFLEKLLHNEETEEIEDYEFI